MSQQHYKILLVEDDEVDQESFRRFVQKENLPYQYTIVESRKECINLIAIEKFDIVLVDFSLGDGTAFDLIEVIREDAPVIIITGKGDEEIAVEAMKLGAQDYLVKDLERKYLALLPNIIRNSMKLRQVEEEKRKLTELHETVLRNSFDGIIIMDLKGEILYSNSTMESLTGIPNLELINLGLKGIMFEPQLVSQLIKSCVQQERTFNLETTLIPKIGTPVPIALSARFIKNQGRIIASFRDLRKESELIEELELYRRVSVDQISTALYKIGTMGPEIVFAESLVPAPENEPDLLIKTGVFYSALLGQGSKANTGLFGPLPVSDYSTHVGIVYAFFMSDKLNKDPLMNGKSYGYIVLFMSEKLIPLFNNRPHITDIIRGKLATIPDINDITQELLINLKYQLLSLEEGTT